MASAASATQALEQTVVECPAPIPVFTWHKVSHRLEPGVTALHPRIFARQVEALHQAGARAVSLEHWLQRDGLQDAGEALCLLCFDDAYACVARHAAPLLADAGFVATLFPVLDWIGRDNRWDRGLLGRRFRHLDEDGISALLKEGWSLGLHGRSHLHLAGRGLELLERELVTARAELELRFGRSVHAVAWPYGRCDRRAMLVAQAAGLRAGFGRCGSSHAMCRPRLMVYPHHDPAAMRAMLAGRGEDWVQRAAGLGALLSSWIGGGREAGRPQA